MHQKFPKGSAVFVLSEKFIGRIEKYDEEKNEYYLLEIDEPFLIYDPYKESDLELIELEGKELEEYCKVVARLNPRKKGGFGSLSGFFKEVYSQNLAGLIPDGVKLLNKISFPLKDTTSGNLYHAPVILGTEHGITFNEKKGES